VLFFTSDLHFDHTNIIKFCERPFSSAEEMNEVLISNWNDVVQSSDDVYILGDFSFARKPELACNHLRRLKGRKFLIRGNHDEHLLKFKEFRKMFCSVSDILEIKVSKIHIVMCHYAMRVWNKSHNGSIHLYGHSHGTLSPADKSVDVGVDSHFVTGVKHYRPFSLDEIMTCMDALSASSFNFRGGL
jgi:calcineurin-like phosphoesterase family protein